MKRMVLKKSVENLLIGLEVFLIIIIASINDVEMQGIPIIAGMCLLAYVIYKILEKYGRTGD